MPATLRHDASNLETLPNPSPSQKRIPNSKTHTLNLGGGGGLILRLSGHVISVSNRLQASGKGSFELLSFLLGLTGLIMYGLGFVNSHNPPREPNYGSHGKPRKGTEATRNPPRTITSSTGTPRTLQPNHRHHPGTSCSPEPGLINLTINLCAQQIQTATQVAGLRKLEVWSSRSIIPLRIGV